MQRQVDAAMGKPGEDVLLSFASDTEAFYGRLGGARRLSQRAIESARGSESKETAAAWRMNAALREAEFDNMARSRQEIAPALAEGPDRKSTRLNSSHGYISYAVFCLKKKKTTQPRHPPRAWRIRSQDPAFVH